MRPCEPGMISFSFVKLRHLAKSFDQVGAGADPNEAALRLAEELGTTALPLCARELDGTDPRRVRWAEVLLGRLGTHPAPRPRVIELLCHLAGPHGGASAAGRERARRLMIEIGAPAIPSPVVVSGVPSATLDPDELGEAPAEADIARAPTALLAGLIHDLETAAEFALAADRMMLELDPDEIVALIEQLSEIDDGAERALRLADEFLLRTDLDPATRAAVRRVRAPLSLPGRCPRPSAKAVAGNVLVGRHDSGRAVVVASRAVTTGAGAGRGRRLRVLCVLTAADGTLIDGLYGDDFSPRRLDGELLTPLRRRGYRFEAPSMSHAALIVRRAACAAVSRGRSLPQAFYLGRDLLGLYDEHCLRPRTRAGDTSLLERGRELLAEGAVKRARGILERFVDQQPENAEGRAALARCLMLAGAPASARSHLLQAIDLDPDNPLHHWNLAAVAHSQGRPGRCYLALLDYLDLVGDGAFDAGAGPCDERIALAEDFVAEYERLARVEYPDAPATEVARADDLVVQARLRLDAGQHESAIALLEQAVALVPAHARAWAALGTALSQRGRPDEAGRCLRRALSLRPGYPEAARALAGLAVVRESSLGAPAPSAGDGALRPGPARD